MKAPQGMPVPLIEALGAVADAMEEGRNPEPGLSRAIDMLSALSAAGVVHVHAHIQYYARLRRPTVAYDPSSSHKAGPPRYGEMIKYAPKLQYLFLFHQDGYARQAALDAIVAVPPAKFYFSAILPRLNDWVPEVRAAAVACLERILPLSDPDTVFELICALFYQSGNWARWTNESALLLLKLQEPAMLLRLLTWLRTAGGGRLSSFMRILLRRPIIDAHLYDLARNAESPSVRGRALRVLLDGGADWDHTPPQRGWWHVPSPPVLMKRRLTVPLPPVQDLVDLGLSDRSAKVRKVVASKIVALVPRLTDLNTVIDRLLADPAEALRWRGDFLNRTMRRQ